MENSNSTQHTGIILLNLGTPDTPEPRAIRRFLASFLADKKVIQLPRLIWLPILYGFILPFRPRKIAPLYASVWGNGDGPMRSIGKKLAASLQQKLNQQATNHKHHVVLGMTYGNPSLQQAFTDLNRHGCEHIIILPLFPQYSDTSTGASFDAVERALAKVKVNATLHFIRDYYKHPLYISALVTHIQKFWQANGIGLAKENNSKKPKLLMSFHGIPQSYADKGDPYQQQCETTAGLIIEKISATMGLSKSQCARSYQSRFGKATWIKPYTDQTLAEWGEKGLDEAVVICPGFAVDCLETLQEIASENKEIFQQAGGKTFHYIPALNDSAEHADLLFDLVINQATEEKK